MVILIALPPMKPTYLSCAASITYCPGLTGVRMKLPPSSVEVVSKTSGEGVVDKSLILTPLGPIDSPTLVT